MGEDKAFDVVDGGRDEIERALIKSFFEGTIDRKAADALKARPPALTVIAADAPLPSEPKDSRR